MTADDWDRAIHFWFICICIGLLAGMVVWLLIR